MVPCRPAPDDEPHRRTDDRRPRPLLPGLQAVNAILAGPVKLDLIFERLSRSPEVQRPAVVMLVDKVGLATRLNTGWEPPVARVAGLVQAAFSGVRQGGTWPLRLLLRG